MKIQASKLSPTRVALWLLLSLGVLSQIGCSSNARGGWGDSQTVDFSKIFVYAVTPSPNLQLPAAHADAPQALTHAIQQQLAKANWLQTDEGVHSLSFYGVILSYQDGVIDAQGELYDDEQFLVYSRVKRRLEPGENWQQGLDLVAEQMLDELMLKLQPAPGTAGTPPCRLGDYGCTPKMLVQPAPSFVYFDNSCWGCWRDHDYGHGDHDKPKPKPHWVSGAILESVPRSSFDHDIRVHTPRGSDASVGGSTSGSGYGTGSLSTGTSSLGSTTTDSTSRPRTIYVPPTGQRSDGERSTQTRAGGRSIETSSGYPTAGHRPSEHGTETPAISIHSDAPRSESTRSSPPTVHEPSGSQPSPSSGSSSASSSSSNSGGGHGGGHGGHGR